MRVTFRAFILVLALTMSIGAANAGVEYLYAVDNFSLQLYRIDRATGATIDTIPVTLAGPGSINSVKGLASDPDTQELYAIIRTSQPGEGGGPQDFQLVTIAPDTGIATVIGDLDDRYSGLAFAPPPGMGPTPTPIPFAPGTADTGTGSRTKGTIGSHVLYGVTGDGANIPSTLYVIDTATAMSTFVFTFGTPSDGETIAYNPADGLLYHLSGVALLPNESPEGIDDRVLESLDLTTMARTPISLSGDIFGNGNGLTWDGSAARFLVSTRFGQPDTEGPPPFGNDLFSILPDGTSTFLGPSATFFTGMAFSELVPVEIMSFTIE